MKAYSMDDIIRMDKQAGRFFFSPDTMRFFKSRVHYPAYNGPGGTYFVTSEKFDYNSPRLFTVRKFTVTDDSVDIRTWPEAGFQKYATRMGAHNAAQRYAEGK